MVSSGCRRREEKVMKVTKDKVSEFDSVDGEDEAYEMVTGGGGDGEQPITITRKVRIVKKIVWQ